MKKTVIVTCAAIAMGLGACSDSSEESTVTVEPTVEETTTEESTEEETTEAEETEEATESEEPTVEESDDTETDAEGSESEDPAQADGPDMAAWEETTIVRSEDGAFNMEVPAVWDNMLGDMRSSSQVFGRGDLEQSAAILAQVMGPWNQFPQPEEIEQLILDSTGIETHYQGPATVAGLEAHEFNAELDGGVNVTFFYVNIDGTGYEVTINMAKGVTYDDLKPYVETLKVLS